MIRGRYLQSVAKGGLSSRNYAYLMNRVGGLAMVGYQGVTRLMIGDSLSQGIVQQSVSPNRSGQYSLQSFREMRLSDALGMFAGCQQGCFVDQVGEIGACHPRSRLGDLFKVDARAELSLCAVDFQNLHAALLVRSVHHNLSVETSRACERRVDNLRSVGGRQ